MPKSKTHKRSSLTSVNTQQSVTRRGNEASTKRRRLEVLAMLLVVISSISSWLLDESRSLTLFTFGDKHDLNKKEKIVSEEFPKGLVTLDDKHILNSDETKRALGLAVNSSAQDEEVLERGYSTFKIVDLRGIRPPAYFHAELNTKIGLIYEAYGNLRNNGDSRCFIFNSQRQLLTSDMTIEQAVLDNRTTLTVVTVIDTSEMCGTGLTTDSKLNFFGKEANAVLVARMSRLFLGCALADAAEPDWRYTKYSSSLDHHSASSAQHASNQKETELLFHESGLNPFQLAEHELREALKFGSRGARVALARLVVVAAHFEARPTFLEDARAALGNNDPSAFAEAVATGTRIAAKKASRLLAAECQASKANADAVAAALAAGALVDFRTDQFGRATVLHWAAYRGHASVVSALLAAGADPYIHNDHGLTPIDLVEPDTDTALAFMNAGISIDHHTSRIQLAEDALLLKQGVPQESKDEEKTQYYIGKKPPPPSLGPTPGFINDDPFLSPMQRSIMAFFNKLASSWRWLVRCILHCLSIASIIFLIFSSYNELEPYFISAYTNTRQTLAQCYTQVQHNCKQQYHRVCDRFTTIFQRFIKVLGYIKNLKLSFLLKTITAFFSRPRENNYQKEPTPTTTPLTIQTPLTNDIPSPFPSIASPPPVDAAIEHTSPKKDVADQLADLDLSQLSRDTLDKLDKLLPELQRRVLREVLSRALNASAQSLLDVVTFVFAVVAPKVSLSVLFVALLSLRATAFIIRPKIIYKAFLLFFIFFLLTLL
mmetsp:Transcript_21904/g.33742  ORF Transcript_21904/g.33742 Transcript_21904/m.33742 type:complete len:772 (-) Transcript_21904:2080-4395(-)